MPWQAEMLLISQEMSVYGTRWRAGTTLVRPGVRGKIFEVAGGQVFRCGIISLFFRRSISHPKLSIELGNFRTAFGTHTTRLG